MPDVADLQVKIGADLSGLQRGLEQAQRNIRQFSAGTRTSGAGLAQMQRGSDKAAKGLTDMQRASDQAAKTLKRDLVTSIQAVEGPLSRTGAIVNRLAGPAGFAALAGLGAAAFAGIIAGLAKLSLSAGQAADRLLDLEQSTGLTLEQLQQFRNVERVAGVAMDTIAKSAERLQERIARSPDTFRDVQEAATELGVALTQDVAQDLPVLITVLAEMEDVSRRNALAVQIFGRSWKEIAPVIGLSAEQIRQAMDRTILLTREQAEAANELRASFDLLTGNAKTLALILGAELGDAAAAFFEEISPEKQVSLTTFAENLERTGEALERVAGPLGAVTGFLSRFFGQVSGADTLFGQLFPPDAPRTLEQAQEELAALEAQLEALTAEPLRVNIDTGVATRDLRDALAKDLDNAQKAVTAIAVQLAKGVDAADLVEEFQKASDELANIRDAIIALGTADIPPIDIEFTTPRLDIPALEIPEPTRGGLEGLQRPVGDVTGLAGLDEGLRDAERAAERFRQQMDLATANVFVSLADFGALLAEAGAGLISFQDALRVGLSSVGGALGRRAGTDLGESIGGALGLAAPGIGQILGTVAGGIIGNVVGGIFDRDEPRWSPEAAWRELVFGDPGSGEGLRGEFRSTEDRTRNVNTALERMAHVLADFERLGPTDVWPSMEEIEFVIEELEKELESLTGTTEELNRTFSQMRNQVTGFRVAGARFGATIPGFGPRSPELSALGEAMVASRDAFHVDNLTINAAEGESGESLLRKIETAAAGRRWRGGGGLSLEPNGTILR